MAYTMKEFAALDLDALKWREERAARLARVAHLTVLLTLDRYAPGNRLQAPPESLLWFHPDRRPNFD